MLSRLRGRGTTLWPFLMPYSPECVEYKFSEVRLQDPAYSHPQRREDGFCGPSPGSVGVEPWGLSSALRGDSRDSWVAEPGGSSSGMRCMSWAMSVSCRRRSSVRASRSSSSIFSRELTRSRSSSTRGSSEASAGASRWDSSRYTYRLPSSPLSESIFLRWTRLRMASTVSPSSSAASCMVTRRPDGCPSKGPPCPSPGPYQSPTSPDRALYGRLRASEGSARGKVLAGRLRTENAPLLLGQEIQRSGSKVWNKRACC